MQHDPKRGPEPVALSEIPLDEPGGRFALGRPKPLTPERLPGANWSRDPAPPEPNIDATDCGSVLGFPIDEVKP
jgi:hypothetical protein